MINFWTARIKFRNEYDFLAIVDEIDEIFLRVIGVNNDFAKWVSPWPRYGGEFEIPKRGGIVKIRKAKGKYYYLVEN